MNKPIQETSAEIQTKELKENDEPFVTALKNRKFEIIFFGDKKGLHEFFCSEYVITPSNLWKFLDVIWDSSKKDGEQHVTLYRLTYHPEVSFINVPFMVLPAGEK